MFTQEQILEIKQRLRETSVKDAEFPLASLPLEGDEIITIVQDGENKKFPINLFFESFSQYIDGSERVDFFNVSRYVQITQGYPEVARLTLPEAVESCPEDVRRPGQVITFMDNDDDWVVWQYNGEKKEQWLNIDYWKLLVAALKQELGDREDALLSQKVITENINNLQSQIDAIISDKATVSLSASTSTFIVGEGTFTLTASTDTNSESIVIKQDDTIIVTGSEKTLVQDITVTQETAGNIVYTAEFTFAGGNERTTSATVYFVNKIYVGSGAVYTDVVSDSHAVSARRSPADTYNITVEQDGQYVFFVIPATMSITKATLSGFDFPLDAPVTETVDNVSYKVYRSSNTNDAGTYQIVIS